MSDREQAVSNADTVKYSISNYQLIVLMIGSTTAYGHFVFVHLCLMFAGRDGWISLVSGISFGSLILYLQFKVILGKQGNSIIIRCKEAFGKWGGSGIGVIFVVYFLCVSAITIKTVVTFLGLVYPTTPPSVFVLAELALGVWAVRSGLEVFARTVEFLLPGLIILGLAASMLSMKDKDVTQLLPIFEHGLTPVLKGSLIFVAMFSEFIVYNLAADEANLKAKLPRQSWWFSLIIMVMFLAPVIGPVMVFGEELAKRLAYPTFTEIQYIQVLNIIERFDVAGILLWTIGSFFRVTMFLYSATKGLSQVFNLPDGRTLAIPCALLVGATVLRMIPSTREEVYHFLATAYPILSLFMGFALPLFVVLFATLRGKLGRSQA